MKKRNAWLVVLGVIVIIGIVAAIWQFALVVALIALFVFGGYKAYEASYFNGQAFAAIKDRVSTYVKDCNELNEHIESLKNVDLGIDQVRYGTSDYQDASKWNYQRSKLAEIQQGSNVYSCSREVCNNSQKEPMKYVCKYFGFDANEENLEVFENMLNDFEAVEEGRKLLTAQKDEIMASIDNDIPGLIKKFSAKRLSRELGFEEIDLSDAYYPRFVFKYVSSGGNAALENTIVMNLDNLNAMVNYMNDRIKWKKSVAGQRALMTSSLRRHILDRDNHRCKQCGIGTAEEPHLLLEVDHIVPVSKGGMTSEDNLQTLCWKCNRSKGAKIA